MKGQPVLAGTVAVEHLTWFKVPVEAGTLSPVAKNHERSASVIRMRVVNVVPLRQTTMRHRGTDIKLGESGKFFIYDSVSGRPERHESRRIDNQVASCGTSDSRNLPRLSLEDEFDASWPWSYQTSLERWMLRWRYCYQITYVDTPSGSCSTCRRKCNYDTKQSFAWWRYAWTTKSFHAERYDAAHSGTWPWTWRLLWLGVRLIVAGRWSQPQWSGSS